MSLPPKRQKFVEEYLIDLNATAAAQRAGYANPDTQGPRLLGIVGVREAISAAQAERAAANVVTAQRTIDELAAVAFSDIGELVEFGQDGFHFKPSAQISQNARKAVSSVKIRQEREIRDTNGNVTRPAADVVEFKLWDKVAALTKLAQHLGILSTQKNEQGGLNVNVQIIEQIVMKQDVKQIENGPMVIEHVIDKPNGTANGQANGHQDH